MAAMALEAGIVDQAVTKHFPPQLPKKVIEVKDDLYILSFMMSDRPDTIQTIDIMSGPNYRTDRTHPFRGVLVSGAALIIDRYMELYLATLRMNHILDGAAR
jgi:hypothetical protein